MNSLNYHEMTEQQRNYFHAIEIWETYNVYRQLFGREAENRFVEALNGHRPAYEQAWEYELKRFISQFRTTSRVRDDRILYYLVAGCGMNRISKLLKVGQSTIYRVRDEFLTQNYITTITGVLEVEPRIIANTRYLMQYLNVLDGLRVDEPIDAHTYLPGQVRKR